MIIGCIVVCLCSGYKITEIVQEYNSGVEEYDSLKKYLDHSVQGQSIQNVKDLMDTAKKVKNPINFNALKSVNPDIRAWLKMDGIGVNLPIVQTTDNDTYLHATFLKQYNFAGCLFIDAACKDGLNGYNCIIYGHNMKNGSMFGNLKKYTDAEFYENNKDFYVFMSDRVRKYEIFNVAYVNHLDDAYNVPTDEQQNYEYLKMMYPRSIINTGVQVSSKDKTITLSTCTTEVSTRLVVQAKIIAERVFDE